MKILIMMAIAGGGFYIQLVITCMYTVSEFSFTLPIALAIFGIIVTIQIILYSKVRKEINLDLN